jgi:hypothetical protein
MAAAPPERIAMTSRRPGGFVWTALAALLLLLLSARPLEAASTLNPSIVPDGARYFRRAVTGQTGTAETFPAGVLSVIIENEDATNDLLIRFTRNGLPVANAELTAPADATWSEVIPIPPGRAFLFDVAGSPGFVWDRAGGSGAFNVVLVD